MKSHSATAVILAAGLGTRMKSALPKAMQPLAGRPMLATLLASVREQFDRIVVVTGPDMDDVAAVAGPEAQIVVQTDRLGTGHAARQAAACFGEGDVAILYADNPLILPQTLERLLQARNSGHTGLALLAMRPADPGRYGRVIVRDGMVERIVEWADASEEERAVPLCNAGVICARADDLRRWLEQIDNNNAKGEYYLTDVVALARRDGVAVRAVEAPEEELRGINSRVELAEAEAVIQTRFRRAAMEAGVTLTAPETVFFSHDTCLEQDVTVAPHVVFGPGVTVRSGAEIRAFSHLEGCEVGPGCMVGPYARLRPGTLLARGVHVGNFVELKATEMAEGAKANHLTYLGDASVGKGTNIGAGTITCNYDGYLKHRTQIGAGAFIGSDSILVAPVSVGDGALIAASSIITDDVPQDALAIGRARQINKPGQGAQLRALLKKKKEEG
ncbi:bifunctional UDP-N-acetylglucosamine diphosphorylase/glucosamine-1-phosphate N-acetyltransferase GlmU [Acetobacter sp. AN02]|uniref:bifunctional UDP-N-acetylglucosamine diphosphorylase/glucosamine-1-phosphate N-acetyltransferase GlmU n=1 Tax=Acetobacter sp. AN02 TaxID=2894186 RepID=UPI00243439B6|nr:bifunctional UDP-N-acetylglucosamine diphosphorylase/glucosamine-1-phosphate N-acetyltransferase GlmU [Acetobacter sp. AN02]MDG6095186.1 bifunctional UDP-N-acetylglucosamine diphosphorylase/glucosamine-1-phosphate N-acetyltransferase GlmU [Acetobacter sp. AN02]